MTPPWWARVEGAGEEPRKRRSTYDAHGLVVAGDDDTDPDVVEPGWHRVGEIDRQTGAWINGRPRWPGG